MKKPITGKYLKIMCSRCRHTQILYGKGSTRVKCAKCNKLLVQPTGGKMRIRTIIREVFT